MRKPVPTACRRALAREPAGHRVRRSAGKAAVAHPCASRRKYILYRLAPAAGLLTLFAFPASAALDAPTQTALNETYYEFEVAGYCSLVNDAVAAGFHRRVARILAGRAVEQKTLNHLRGKAWQAAHWEWQNRGLGGFRGWCRKEGKAAADGFLSEPR
jgi:hypothetical protein